MGAKNSRGHTQGARSARPDELNRKRTEDRIKLAEAEGLLHRAAVVAGATASNSMSASSVGSGAAAGSAVAAKQIWLREIKRSEIYRDDGSRVPKPRKRGRKPKLHECDAQAIRAALAEGASVRRLAVQYKVSRETIRGVREGGRIAK